MPPMRVSLEQARSAWVRLGQPDVDIEQLRLGMEVEQEHTRSLPEAAEIALDHLKEFGDYYTRLAKMEDRARAGLAPNEILPNGGRSSSAASFDKLFDQMEEKFPDFGSLELIADDEAHDGGRHFAYCRYANGDIQIAFAPIADERLTPDQMEAMMAHEMGHALDYRYGADNLSRMFGSTLSDDTELRADQIAEHVFGFPIRYDAKCGYVQTKSAGIYPRPKGLR